MRLKHLIPEFVRQFDDGMTTRQIADTHGCRIGYVRESLNRVRPGCVVARHTKELEATRNSKSTEQIALKILRGLPLKQVALDAGMTYGAVWHLGRRNGMRKLCDVKRDRAKKMAARWAQGAPQKRIAAEFGISQMGVSAAIRRVMRLSDCNESGCDANEQVARLNDSICLQDLRDLEPTRAEARC